MTHERDQSAAPHIAAATVRDVPALARVWLELMQMHEQRDAHYLLADDGVQRWMEMAQEMVWRDDAFLLKAELPCQGPNAKDALRATEVVGFCLGWVANNPNIYRHRHVGFISEVAVSQAVRRRGVGRKLMQAAASWFAERGLDEYQLSCAIWNESAQAFWRSLGGEPLLVRYRFNSAPA
jgi:ribosomal protein S18 acetylase RimI-like enzyme